MGRKLDVGLEKTYVAVCVLVLITDACRSLKIEDFSATKTIIQGHDFVLQCVYDLEGDILYSVKWYKDGQEFYRYVPGAEPVKEYFFVPGVVVNVAASSDVAVMVQRAAAETAGVYSCEVSGEAPLFRTVAKTTILDVVLIPEEDPVIEGARESYHMGETADLICSSPPSRPPARLLWLVNGAPAPAHAVTGPLLRQAGAPTGATVSSLRLTFTVLPRHFRYGLLHLKCVAVVKPWYKREVQSDATPGRAAGRAGPAEIAGSGAHSTAPLQPARARDLPSDADTLPAESHARGAAVASWKLIAIVTALSIVSITSLCT